MTDSEPEDNLSPFCCAGGMLPSYETDKTSVGKSVLPSSLWTPSSSICFIPTITAGYAYDLILVRSSKTLMTACGEPTFSFRSFGSLYSNFPSAFRVVLEVELNKVHPLAQQRQGKPIFQFEIDKNLIIRLPEDGATNVTMQERGDQEEAVIYDSSALNALADMLESGCNRCRYLLLNEADIVVACTFVNVHLWNDHDRIAIVDIDGTITKSNMRGVFDTILTQTFSHCHDGVCELLSQLPPGVRVVYLTARPMSLSDKTRNFLSSLRQANHSLPQGALIGFTGSLTQMLFMELIHKSANEFKKEAIQRHVVRPFQTLGVTVTFSAAFGNTLMDMEAYHAAGMDLHSIYLVDKQSRIFCLDGKNLGGTKVVVDRHEFYLLSRGSNFYGYKDQKLLTHISERIKAANI
jgi:hypothetical protein